MTQALGGGPTLRALGLNNPVGKGHASDALVMVDALLLAGMATFETLASSRDQTAEAPPSMKTTAPGPLTSGPQKSRLVDWTIN